MYGSDQAASIEPNGLRQLVGAVRKIEKALGNGKKDVTESEVPVAKKLREHIKEEEENLVTVNQVGVMQEGSYLNTKADIKHIKRYMAR